MYKFCSQIAYQITGKFTKLHMLTFSKTKHKFEIFDTSGTILYRLNIRKKLHILNLPIYWTNQTNSSTIINTHICTMFVCTASLHLRFFLRKVKNCFDAPDNILNLESLSRTATLYQCLQWNATHRQFDASFEVC